MTCYAIGGLGFVGGLLPDLLRIIKGKEQKPPDYLKSAFFWICVLIQAAIGGGTAILLTKSDDALKALALGFSAPEILTRLLSGAAKDRGVGDIGLVAKMRAWWAI